MTLLRARLFSLVDSEVGCTRDSTHDSVLRNGLYDQPAFTALRLPPRISWGCRAPAFPGDLALLDSHARPAVDAAHRTRRLAIPKRVQQRELWPCANSRRFVPQLAL